MDERRARKPSMAVSEVGDAACGFGSWRPKFLQKFANPKMFLLDFSLIGVLRSAYFTYMISVLTTVEKRYAFPNKLSAFILIADNISGMVVSPIVGYFGKKVNGPKLIGLGMMLVSASCFLSGMPYLFYGPPSNQFFEYANTSFSSMFKKEEDTYQMCEHGEEKCDKDNRPFQIGAFAFLWIASFVNGLGYTTFWTIGLPYIDDNVKKKNSPMYISTSTVIRLTGVSFGFFLSSFCLSLYEDPTRKMDIPRKDPRWIGAWWMGFFVFGTLIFLFSLPMFFFPPSMKKNAKPLQRRKSKTGISDAFATFKRVVTNPILVFDTVGGGIRYLGLAGYWVTKPRYIESQFSQSASSANFLTGATSTVMNAVGILLGGLFISKYKPKPRLLIGLVILVELTCNLFLFTSMFIGCPMADYSHLGVTDETVDLQLKCNEVCDCTTRVFQPVCDVEKSSHYFNPCFAGCNTVNTNVTPHEFAGCACRSGATLVRGFCENNCTALPVLLAFQSIAGLVSSFARTANVIIALRAVAPEDKSFAMGLVGSYMALFVYIPYPLVFGYVVDSACLVWEKSCGEKGNCWLYDSDKFRYYLHGTAFSFAMVGSFFDFLVLMYANRLKHLYDDEPDEKHGTNLETIEEEPNSAALLIHENNK